jgi:hypothetical protein
LDTCRQKAEREKLLRLPVESYSIYKYLNHRLGRYNATGETWFIL